MLRETEKIIGTAQNKPFLQPTIIIELKNKEVLDYDVELFRTVGVFPTLKRLVSQDFVEAVYFISHIPTEQEVIYLSQNKIKVEVHNVNSLFRVIPPHISDIITSINRGRKSYE